MRLVNKNSLINLGYHSGIIYPVPISINYFWNFGSLSLLCLGLQLFTVYF